MFLKLFFVFLDTVDEERAIDDHCDEEVGEQEKEEEEEEDQEEEEEEEEEEEKEKVESPDQNNDHHIQEEQSEEQSVPEEIDDSSIEKEATVEKTDIPKNNTSDIPSENQEKENNDTSKQNQSDLNNMNEEPQAQYIKSEAGYEENFNNDYSFAGDGGYTDFSSIKQEKDYYESAPTFDVNGKLYYFSFLNDLLIFHPFLVFQLKLILDTNFLYIFCQLKKSSRKKMTHMEMLL